MQTSCGCLADRDFHALVSQRERRASSTSFSSPCISLVLPETLSTVYTATTLLAHHQASVFSSNKQRATYQTSTMPPKHHRSPSPSPPDPSNPSNPTDHPNPNQTTGTTAAPPKRHKSSTTSSRAAGIDRDEPGWFRLDYITQIQNGGGASAMPPTFRTPGWSFGARGDGGGEFIVLGVRLRVVC